MIVWEKVHKLFSLDILTIFLSSQQRRGFVDSKWKEESSNLNLNKFRRFSIERRRQELWVFISPENRITYAFLNFIDYVMSTQLKSLKSFVREKLKRLVVSSPVSWEKTFDVFKILNF